MKQTKPSRAAQQPQIWCEDCCVRIAPYEDFVTHKNRKLHQQCFQKSERRVMVPAISSTERGRYLPTVRN